VTRPADRAAEILRGSVAALAQRLDRLAGALEQRDRELVATRQTLATLWARVERLERRAQRGAAPARPEPAPRAEQAPLSAPERVPAAAAARRLGLAPATVRRMVAEGRLDGLAIEAGGRRLWTVSLDSLARLERGAVGAPDATDPRISGAPSAREGG
jgi:hypothetical protein